MSGGCSISIAVLAIAAAAVAEARAGVLAVDDGIEYVATTEIAPAAVRRAQEVVNVMLRGSPGVRAKLRARKFRIEIIGRKQVLTDLPEYANLRGRKTRDGRDPDTGTRGMGGPELCSVGEENLLCLKPQQYWEEDILVHEFSHSIKFNLDPETQRESEDAYANALKNSLYPRNAYIMRTAQEYSAEATQAWFQATVRLNVTGGVNTRAKLRERDPKLAAIFERVYGAAELTPVPGCRY